MYALEIKNLSKTYANGFQAIKDISFKVKDGDFFALLGPNGAGKSTLIHILMTLSKKNQGEVKIYGYDLDKQTNEAKACIGVVPQEFNFNWYDTVLEVVINQAGYYGISKEKTLPLAKKYLTELGLGDKLSVPLIRLSGGMKRRVMIARALVTQPKLLILDEPTAGVDLELRRSLWEFLKQINQDGVTIILTTHYLEEAESLCKHIAIINEGRIIENTSMHELLQTLDEESFVLYTDEVLGEVSSLPDAWRSKRIDDHSLELTLRKSCQLNEVFKTLSQYGIDVTSMRNKSNRLETLFINRLNAD